MFLLGCAPVVADLLFGAIQLTTGWDRQSFTTMEANRVLTRLGFNCCRAGRQLDDQPALGPGNPWQQELSFLGARLSAAEAALAVAQGAIAGLRAA